MANTKPGILFEKPGSHPIRLTRVLLDYNGTLALDGNLFENVSSLLMDLSRLVDVTIITLDTFGTAREQLSGLPVEVRIAANGSEKKQFVASLSGGGVAAIGNGMNDTQMFTVADIAIGIIGPEGAAADLLKVATVIVTTIEDALGLLLTPKRLTATLRP